MEYLNRYWSQIVLILGMIGYLLKTVLDYRIKKKDLRYRYFYEIKAQKIIELFSKIVEIQTIVDRRKGGDEFGTNVFKSRIDLDRFYWESKFYFNKKTQNAFQLFTSNLMLFESEEIIQQYPEIERDFDLITRLLLKEFKREIT